MELYLVQHGQAQPREIDAERSLTERGRQQTRRVGALAARLDLDLYQIHHSGKTRAQQTAAILEQALAPSGGVVEVSGLAPKDDVRPIADALAGESGSLMLVGHLPFLTRLAGLLLAGDPDRGVIKFRNSAIVCLERSDDGWQVAWILTPELASA